MLCVSPTTRHGIVPRWQVSKQQVSASSRALVTDAQIAKARAALQPAASRVSLAPQKLQVPVPFISSANKKNRGGGELMRRAL